MKLVVRLLKILFGFVLGLSALVIAAALLVIVRPRILINERTIGWAADFARRHEWVDVSWKELSVGVESRSLLKKGIDLGFTGLCVRAPARGAPRTDYSACFDRARIAVAGDFARLKPRLASVGPIEMTGGNVLAKLAEAKPAEKEKRPEPSKKAKASKTASGEHWIPKWLEDTELRPIRVEIARWQVDRDGSEYTGQAFVGTEAEQSLLRLVTRLSARSDDGMKAGLAGRFEFPGFQRELGPNARMQYQLDASFEHGRGQAGAHAEGQLAPGSFKNRLQASASRLIPGVARAEVHDCDLDVERRSVKLACPVGMSVPLPPVKFSPEIKFPTRAGAFVSADLRTTAFPPDPSKPVDGTVQLKLDPILTPVLHGEGQVESKVAGVPSEFPRGWKLDTNAEIQAGIPEFKKIVRALHRTDMAIWAPIHALHGSLEIGARGHFDLMSGVVPLHFETRLASKGQSLVTDATGELRYKRVDGATRLDAVADLALSDVKLSLPRLDAEAPPQLFPDSRFSKEKEKEKPREEASMFHYDIHVHTPDGHPVLLVSNLAKKPVPIALDLHVASTGTSGTVQVQSFPLAFAGTKLQYLKRDAIVDHFTIDLAQPSSASEIDGAIDVDYTDYTITVHIVGTTGKPTLQLTSDPPLDDQQIWAVLLFGKTLDELDPDQTKSAGDVRAAAVDGAVGLGSLYVLASTPIESVGYDPRTGVVSAKVGLGGGTSLNLGTDTQSLTDIGIRKRLSKHWSITTDLQRGNTSSAGNQDQRTASAFLEWAYRY